MIAAYVLHNICIERGDFYDADDDDDSSDDDDDNPGGNGFEIRNTIRDCLKDYVWNNL